MSELVPTEAARNVVFESLGEITTERTGLFRNQMASRQIGEFARTLAHQVEGSVEMAMRRPAMATINVRSHEGVDVAAVIVVVRVSRHPGLVAYLFAGKCVRRVNGADLPETVATAAAWLRGDPPTLPPTPSSKAR